MAKFRYGKKYQNAMKTGEVDFIDESGRSDYGSRDVDYSSLIWRQLDRIMKAGTYNADSMYISAVLELHQLLMPYHTPKYTEYVSALKRSGAKALDEIKPKERPVVRQRIERQIAYLMFGKLVNLMTGKGILPCKVWTSQSQKDTMGI